MYAAIGIIFFIWVVFFGGAEKLENTLLGYFEFGVFALKASYIKAFAWLSLFVSVGFLFLGS